MYFFDDVNGRMIFDEVSESYVEGRPGYPSRMYSDISDKIFQGKSISKVKNILEVGSGSGQATSQLEKWSKCLVCVEPGKNFTGLLRNAYQHHKNVEVICSTYEAFTSKKRFDVIFSGCALHWVPKKIAIKRSSELLEPGGWLIGAWNMPQFAPEVYVMIAKVIHPIFPEFDIPRGTKEQIDFFQSGIVALAETRSFTNISSIIYNTDRELDPSELLSLIWSYMDLQKISDYGVSKLKLEVKEAIRDLDFSRHIVKNVYPVAYAQKI